MRILYISFLLIFNFIFTGSFAQSGYTLVDSCHNADNSYISDNRTYLAETDSGIFLIYQEIQPNDTAWTTTGYTHETLHNEIEYYDSSGHVIERIFQSRDSSIWINYARTLYTYDTNGNLTDSMGQNYDGTNWINSWLYQRQVNASGHLLFHQFQSWYNGQWIDNGYRTEWYYNAAGDDTMRITFTGDTISWVNETKLRKSYNAFGMTDSLGYQWNGTIWINTNRDQYFYQALNLDTLAIVYAGNVQSWDTVYIYHNTYDSLGNLVFMLLLRNDAIQMVNYQQFFYTYDSLHQVTEEVRQSWNGSTWTNVTRITTSYGSGFFELTENWNGTTWECYTYISRSSNSSLSYSEVTGGYSAGDCNNSWIMTDIQVEYDTAGRLIARSYDGHAGDSHGNSYYDYDADGFLRHSYSYGSTMGGITHEYDCYHFHPLFASFDRSFYSVCSGDSIKVNVYPNGGIPPYSFHWINNNQHLSDTTVSSPYYITPSYNSWLTYVVTDSLGNFFTDSIHIILHPEVNLGNDTVICHNASLQLSPGPFASYHWQNGSTDSTFLATSPGSLPDTILYWVQVSDSTGCLNSDSLNVYFDVCADISLLPNLVAEFFPNPLDRNGELFIRIDREAVETIIRSQYGQVVYKNHFQSHLSLKNILSPGIYFLTLYNKDGVITKRLVVI
jgi:hypothetical protein